MRRVMMLAAVVIGMSLAGCYHAVVHTGATPAVQVIENDWAKGFLWGLLPPDEIAAGEVCENGVSRVETEHSFLNSIVAGITLGIYTPMSIRVVCSV